MGEIVNKRINWIDTLRGIAMFFVVWGHCQKNNTFIRKYIYSFHMPLFFFISGLTFGESDKLSFKEYTYKKINGLIIPYIILNIILYIINIILYLLGINPDFNYLRYFSGIIYSNNQVLNIPCGPSWFLLTLFLIEIIFYFFKKKSKSDFELGVVCSLCGLMSYVNSLSEYQIRGPWHIEAVFTGVVFYYLGYLFMKKIKKFDFVFKDKIRIFTYGFLLCILGFAGQIFNRRVSMDGNLYGSIFLFYFNSLCSISGLLLLVNLFLKKSIIFKNIGKKTMFFLGYHVVIIDILKNYFPILNSNYIYMFLTCLITFTILYILSFPVYKYFPYFVGKIGSSRFGVK